MLQKARDLAGRRFVRGLALSLALHALVVALVLMGAMPAAQHTAKRGEPLVIELSGLPEPPPRGNPSASSLTARPQPLAARPSPPASKPAPPAPRLVAPTQPSEPAEKPPSPPAPALVATAPPAAASTPTPLPPEPSATDNSSPTVPVPKVEAPTSESAQPQPPAGGGEPAPSRGPLVASVPSSPPAAPPVDIRSAFGRSGGAGTVRGGGWGGITGDPIGLDSPDPRFRDYLERVRRQIQAKMVHPCIRHPGSYECEYKNASLIVHFGILKNGNLQVVEVVRPSEWSIYDEYSMNAIKLAQPFPPIPAAIMALMKPGSAGMPIEGHFMYSVTTTLGSILR